MEEYRVKSNLLHAAIWGGTGCYQWGGYTSADNGKYGRALIEYPANIVTSYAHDGKLYEYNSWMSIIREVPVELIIMYNTCLYHPSNVCAYQIHGGESEVWVVEKNVFGYTKLPKECFWYERVPKKDMVDARNKQDEFSYNKVAKCKRGSLCSSTLYPVLPCKRNWLINALVSRQAKK